MLGMEIFRAREDGVYYYDRWDTRQFMPYSEMSRPMILKLCNLANKGDKELRCYLEELKAWREIKKTDRRAIADRKANMAKIYPEDNLLRNGVVIGSIL